MDYLVTGAAGFIGFHVAQRLLSRGERVVGVDNINDYYSVAPQERPPWRNSRSIAASRFHQVDLADFGALSDTLKPVKIRKVVHLAAQAARALRHGEPAMPMCSRTWRGI